MPGIRWTETAANDLTRICDYVQEHDGTSVARRVALKIYERVESLTQFPYSGRTGRMRGTRELGYLISRFIASAKIPSKSPVSCMARRSGRERSKGE